ncbi:hypothetical protein [Pseudomonas abietaniphila]|uniref:Uncharacterized protein n=1 Tax=Pseudomonas abietaniphila TaxID=89065 RepID=A0A1G7RPV4_9PSED|nr:hypothetical protein [Pseudomonas abietaniphila]SDG12735.1 hypothetical protein SAMN05216605_101217 [Pseudomonas abietaniphila]
MSAINAFYCDLNDFCRKYLDSNRQVSKEEFAVFVPRKMQVDASTFENLMIFEKTMFKVYGENIPLAYLIGTMGERAFEELIEQDALGFVLWKPLVTHFVDKIEGLDPLSYGNTSSPAHSDPEQSLELGLQWLKKPLKRSKRRAFVRKLRDKYQITDDELPQQAVGLAVSAYSSGRLDVYGFDSKQVAYRDIPHHLIGGLAKHADSILEYIYLLDNQLSSVSKVEYHDYLTTSSNRFNAASSAMNNFCRIAEYENIPDLKSMYHNSVDPFAKLVKIRNKGYAKKFRSWLSDLSDEVDSEEVLRAYYEAILKPQGFLHTGVGKMTKTITMSAIGMGVGALVGGPAAAMLGAAGGKLIEGAADVGLDMLDQHLLDGILQGWTPRVFMEKIDQANREGASKGRIEPTI